ncbi:hypothetical protein CEXT_378241 [Caerostris extrusa]|uniref:Uncharacterized protein n=1 Tax=Caerostris extrusa TaxID=172846 RepID=A0AAV4RM50_CAEEX|nr:hypothetical protein CEXT_378241 [Caerostris extrusa]
METEITPIGTDAPFQPDPLIWTPAIASSLIFTPYLTFALFFEPFEASRRFLIVLINDNSFLQTLFMHLHILVLQSCDLLTIA